jgi:signal transduction histidine kinase
MTPLSTTAPFERAPARHAPEHARRIEELGQIIAAYNEVTEKLQRSHDQLTRTVQSLQQELGEKNRLLERKNRLAALGEMAAGMAHEIRNPLGGIQLYASLLARDVCDRPDALQRVKKISGGVKRLESLVGQVLQFTREITAHPAPINLAEVVEQAVEFAGQALAGGQIECNVDGPRPMAASADAVLLGQAVLNLLLNAVQAIGAAPRREPRKPAGEPETPALRGRTSGAANLAGDSGPTLNMESDSPGAVGSCDRITVSYGPPPSGSPARQFHLVVQDTGPGVPPAVMDRIFNPFFTTRDQGTGLGLSIVHRIVEAHDGTIHVTNPSGGGARFEIRV